MTSKGAEVVGRRRTRVARSTTPITALVGVPFTAWPVPGTTGSTRVLLGGAERVA